MRKEICKKHGIELTQKYEEFTGFPLKGKLECKHCIDDLDFWLPMPFVLTGIGGIIYFILTLNFFAAFLGVSIIGLFLTEGSTWRVLRRYKLSLFKEEGKDG